ncbi:MAG TPA: dihydroorotate dehydrogenase [Acidimicrobiia bacterium]|nr:dihydroorotate dehydrogenase [Acidimicrobiia bacterium]
MIDLAARLGPVGLRSPLVAASGTVGSVVEFTGVTDFRWYGAAVAKSVSDEPWPGRPAPRVGPAGVGMLNGIGIQNPGVRAWVDDVVPQLAQLDVPVWGSVVGHTVDGFVTVARAMVEAGLPVLEVNLSCPNLEGELFALDPARSAAVIGAIRQEVAVPIAAKLSPNSEDIVAVASACATAGADWVVLTNTVWGAGIDLDRRAPVLSGVIGGYSGRPLKPIALRCVIEVHRALPELPILGLGGITSGDDVVEYTLAGASAVGIGTVHFAEPRAARRIVRETEARLRKMGESKLSDLVGQAVAA